MFIAEQLPYSETRGQTISIRKEKDGPVICQLSVRPVEPTDSFDHKVQSQNLAYLIVERFNSHD